MSDVVIRRNGVVTLPAQVRRECRLEEGDHVQVLVTEDGILLKPMKLVDSTQAWFWSAAWQSKEAEADADLAAGRFERYEGSGEFLASLDE